MQNALLVRNFIEQIWNLRDFEKMDDFLHPSFHDHSLPLPLTPDRTGTKKWIMATGISFTHHTVIEEQVTEGDKSMVKIRMNLQHIGPWRDIPATGIDLHTIGYRLFEIKDGKIFAHWALIDGQAIENQLKEAHHGCKVAL